MLKNTPFVFAVFIILLIIVVGLLNQGTEQKNNADYSGRGEDYAQYLVGCKQTSDESCCRASVEIMKRGGYRQAYGGCSRGEVGNRLKCISSFKWCEPARN